MLSFRPLIQLFLFALSSFHVLLLIHLAISFSSILSFVPLIQPFPHSLSSFYILIPSSHLSLNPFSHCSLSSLHTLLLIPSSLLLISFSYFSLSPSLSNFSFPSHPPSLSIHSLIVPSHPTLHFLPLVVTHSPSHLMFPFPFHCFLSFFSFIQPFLHSLSLILPPSPHPILTSPSHFDFSFLSFIQPFPLILLPSSPHPISFHSQISPSQPTLTFLPLMTMPTFIHHFSPSSYTSLGLNVLWVSNYLKPDFFILCSRNLTCLYLILNTRSNFCFYFPSNFHVAYRLCPWYDQQPSVGPCLCCLKSLHSFARKLSGIYCLIGRFISYSSFALFLCFLFFV